MKVSEPARIIGHPMCDGYAITRSPQRNSFLLDENAAYFLLRDSANKHGVMSQVFPYSNIIKLHFFRKTQIKVIKYDCYIIIGVTDITGITSDQRYNNVCMIYE